MSISFVPSRRIENLTIQAVGDETLLYDEIRHKAFCLNLISGTVWKFADGRRTIGQIADAVSSELTHPVTEEIVRFALKELQRDGLLQGESAVGELHAVSRRSLVKKLGYGAAMMMPVVTAVFAPPSAHAAYGCLLPDTLVQLADGSEIAARDVRVNQWLRGVDPKTGEFHRARVEECFSFRSEGLMTFFTESGESVQSSASHLFIADAGDALGTRADRFKAGDQFLVYNPERKRAVTSTITAIQTSKVPQEVVNFELNTVEHCYVAGGVVSHNFPIKQSSPANDSVNY